MKAVLYSWRQAQTRNIPAVEMIHTIGDHFPNSTNYLAPGKIPEYESYVNIESFVYLILISTERMHFFPSK